MLDDLDLADDKPKVKLKHLLLDDSETKDDSIAQLQTIIVSRLDEGHGECLFDVGLEDNGDGQALTEQEWDAALARLRTMLEKLKADWKILITKNVPDSPVDVGNEVKKEKGCVGKVMIRRRPENIDDTIETRIAVVGNVDAGKSTLLGVLVKGGLDDGRGKGSRQLVQAQTRDRVRTNQLSRHGDHGIRYQGRSRRVCSARTQAQLGGDREEECESHLVH